MRHILIARLAVHVVYHFRGRVLTQQVTQGQSLASHTRRHGQDDVGEDLVADYGFSIAFGAYDLTAGGSTKGVRDLDNIIVVH